MQMRSTYFLMKAYVICSDTSITLNKELYNPSIDYLTWVRMKTILEALTYILVIEGLILSFEQM